MPCELRCEQPRREQPRREPLRREPLRREQLRRELLCVSSCAVSSCAVTREPLRSAVCVLCTPCAVSSRCGVSTHPSFCPYTGVLCV